VSVRVGAKKKQSESVRSRSHTHSVFVDKGMVCAFKRAKVVYDPAKITSR